MVLYYILHLLLLGKYQKMDQNTVYSQQDLSFLRKEHK